MTFGRKRKLSYEAIADILSNDSEDGRKFDRATIYRAYKSMPELPIDAQFQWHKMDNEEYDLPWEASAYLLELWRFTVERGVYSLEEMDLPTVREVRWRWRIHLADLDLDMSGVLSLAWAFWAREIMQDLLEVPMELDDLEALLAYKPWQNNEMFEDYLRAIREQRIPFINGFSIDEMDKKI